MPIKVENIEWDDEDSLSTAPSGDNIEWDDETSGIELDDETRSDFIPALKLGTAGLAKGIGLGLQIPKYLKPEEPEEPMTYPSPFTTATGEPIQKTEMPATMRRMPGAAPYEEYKEAVLEPVARAGEALQEVGERAIEEHPEWQRPEELTDDWLEMLKDPEKRWRYIARAAGENIPNLAGAVAVTAATAPVLGPVALATGFGFSALLEGGFSFDELQQLTGDKEKAADIATNVGIIAGAIEMLPVGRLFAVNPGIKKAFLKKATKEMLKKSFIVRGGVEGLKQALFEGGTEGIQTFVGNVGKKVFDENQDLFKDIPESVFIGALLGGPTGTVTGAFPTGQKKTQKEIKADWAKAIKVFRDDLSSGALSVDQARTVIQETHDNGLDELAVDMQEALSSHIKEGKEVETPKTPEEIEAEREEQYWRDVERDIIRQKEEANIIQRGIDAGPGSAERKEAIGLILRRKVAEKADKQIKEIEEQEAREEEIKANMIPVVWEPEPIPVKDITPKRPLEGETWVEGTGWVERPYHGQERLPEPQRRIGFTPRQLEEGYPQTDIGPEGPEQFGPPRGRKPLSPMAPIELGEANLSQYTYTQLKAIADELGADIPRGPKRKQNVIKAIQVALATQDEAREAEEIEAKRQAALKKEEVVPEPEVAIPPPIKPPPIEPKPKAAGALKETDMIDGVTVEQFSDIISSGDEKAIQKEVQSLFDDKKIDAVDLIHPGKISARLYKRLRDQGTEKEEAKSQVNSVIGQYEAIYNKIANKAKGEEIASQIDGISFEGWNKDFGYHWTDTSVKGKESTFTTPGEPTVKSVMDKQEAQRKEYIRIEGGKKQAEIAKEPWEMTRGEWVERETEDDQISRGPLALRSGGRIPLEPQVENAVEQFWEWGIRTRSSAGYQWDPIRKETPKGRTGITYEKGKIPQEAISAVKKEFPDVNFKGDNSISFSYEFKGTQDDRSKAINVGHVKEKWNKILNLIKPFVSHKLLVKKAISEGKPVPEKVLAEYPDLAEKPKYTEDQLKGIKVETTAIREATGEKIKIKEDATAALDSAKKDINEYKKLLNCLR